MQLTEQIGMVLLVFALLGGLLWLAKRRGLAAFSVGARRAGNGRRMEVLERVPLTPQHALQEAIAQIDNKKLHGLVLNDAHITKHSSYYYGYAGHADGKDEEVVDTL